METLFLKISTKVDRATRFGFLIVLLGCLPLIYFSPLYTDEVAWKWISARYFLDGNKTISLYPQCVAEFANHLPTLFIPAFWLNSLVYGKLDSLLTLRIGSLFTLIGILLLLGLVFRKTNKNILLAPLSLGVLPFSFILNRPEQLMLISLLLVVYVSLSNYPSRSAMMGGFLLFILGSMLFFSAHAKSLFFLPILFVGLWISSFPRALKVVGSMLIFGLGLSCYLYFSAVTFCENPAIKNSFSGMMISPESFFTDPWGSLIQAKINIGHASRYLTENLFKDRYVMEWLPENYGFWVGAFVLNQAIILFWLGALGVLMVTVVKQKGKCISLARSILMSLICLSIFQTSKSFYDGPLVLTLLWVAMGLSFKQDWLKTLKIPLQLLASCSLILLCYRFYPVLKNSWSKRGPLTNQQHSVKIPYSIEIGERVQVLLNRCRIESSESGRHLIVDDLTYPYVWKIKEPYHATYVTGWWGKESISDFQTFFEERRSSGYLAQCHWLPPSLRRQAHRDRDLCCIGPFFSSPQDN